MSAELLRAFLECLSADKMFCDPINSIPRGMDTFYAVKDSGCNSHRGNVPGLLPPVMTFNELPYLMADYHKLLATRLVRELGEISGWRVRTSPLSPALQAHPLSARSEGEFARLEYPSPSTERGWGEVNSHQVEVLEAVVGGKWRYSSIEGQAHCGSMTRFRQEHLPQP